MRLTDTLYQLALEFIDNRIKSIRQAIAETQDSADQETKSSAGDKYETGLSMMQLDMEKQAEQLAEAIRTRDALEKIKMLEEASANGAIRPGSAVETNQENFYIAISAGQLKANNDLTYFAVSPATPIGSKLIGLKVGDSFSFNGKNYNVSKVH